MKADWRPLHALDPALAALVTGRTRSLFAQAMTDEGTRVSRDLHGARVLVTGGGGSIGGQTVRQLAKLDLGALHVTDVSENYLADLVRDLRNEGTVAAQDFRTFVLDYGDRPMERLLGSQKPYDLVLNFAAHKHVRGERDGLSLLSMIDANVLKLARFKTSMRQHGHGQSFFSVSTDKAANPVSLMGASKRVMEDIVFLQTKEDRIAARSARFANVAFSNGSLLQAFLDRLARGQPLAVPRDVRRYFVSLQESGELCYLAATALPPGCIGIPDLDPERHLTRLTDLAFRLLAHLGLDPQVTEDEAEAKWLAANRPQGTYPVLITPPDTAGEKPYEEFLGADETLQETGLSCLKAVRHAAIGDAEVLLQRLADIYAGGSSPEALHEEICAAIAAHVPNFRHAASSLSLDQRM